MRMEDFEEACSKWRESRGKREKGSAEVPSQINGAATYSLFFGLFFERENTIGNAVYRKNQKAEESSWFLVKTKGGGG